MRARLSGAIGCSLDAGAGDAKFLWSDDWDAFHKPNCLLIVAMGSVWLSSTRRISQLITWGEQDLILAGMEEG
jgi:hypothetical protein